jgi:hypothetical protein
MQQVVHSMTIEKERETDKQGETREKQFLHSISFFDYG